MLITAALCLAAKAIWVGVTGGSAWYGTRAVLGCSEVHLTQGEHETAARFERPPIEDPLLDEDEVSDRMAEVLEGRNEFVSDIARTASRVGHTGEVLEARTQFMRHWVAELRVEFPLRENRPSDRAAMSKWLATELRRRGVRVRHIADMVPRAVALALNQSRAEALADLEAEAARIRTLGGRWLYDIKRTLACSVVQQPRPGC